MRSRPRRPTRPEIAADRVNEGRGPGTRGEILTTEYIAAEFAKSCLNPIGERGTYCQPVLLVRVDTSPKSTLQVVKGETWLDIPCEAGFSGTGQPQTALEAFDAVAVFVGHGAFGIVGERLPTTAARERGILKGRLALGPWRFPHVARVVLAMSGGVDSSVAAYLLREQGHDVIGLFMRTGAHTEIDDRADHKKGCCSAIDAGDARRVADRLDIPFYALDFERDFDRIIDYFADEYLNGRTPNPCVVCNSWLKFGQLWNHGQQLEADFIATGHYARMARTATDVELHRAVDLDKDQSYVLYGIRREVLPRLLFPLGDLRKDQVRDLARKAGLGVADKPDSVEICFVPDGDHAGLIRRRRAVAGVPGKFVDPTGEVLGEHDGIERFTIGQRKGLGIAMGSRRYVLKIVPDANEVVLGEREELQATGLRASRMNWLLDPPATEQPCLAKIRYRHQPARAWVFPTGDGAVVRFDEPQSAVTPGQAVVFYEGTRVLGGGWIEEAIAG